MNGTVSVMVTRRSACLNGSGRRITVFSTLKIVLTPARPRARVSTKSSSESPARPKAAKPVANARRNTHSS